MEMLKREKKPNGGNYRCHPSNNCSDIEDSWIYGQDLIRVNLQPCLKNCTLGKMAQQVVEYQNKELELPFRFQAQTPKLFLSLPFSKTPSWK